MNDNKPDQGVYQLFYISNAADSTNDDVINTILKTAVDYNPKHNITGVLLFRAGIFLQLLEGTQSNVENLFKKIKSDPRHQNVTTLFTATNPRIFTDWSMAFKKIEDLDIKWVNEILSWNKLISKDPQIKNDLIIKLLEKFKSNIVR